MAGYRNKRFTIYDAMEAAGVFDANPANTTARDPVSGETLYAGPVEYPRMFYHPTGERRITVPGEYVETKLGVKLLGQQSEIITMTARNPADEEKLREEGWHDHPAKAIHAGGGAAPPMTAGDRIAGLEAELAKLKKDKAAAEGPQPLKRVIAAPGIDTAGL